ncbi:ATP-grasp domain-containing protein [Streptomyces sp. NPDC053367]|uniref:ATP-grasp domain-containing protein n=1 Tax=Streptomyces sp. NPDC053367 TaxID=3365700 RepID=UPI0037D08C68
MPLNHQAHDGVRHLLVVGDERDIVARARGLRPGLRTSVLCTHQEARKMRTTDGHRRVVVVAADAPLEEWTAAARFVHEAEPVDRVVCYGEEGQAPAARIALELGLPWHSPETVRAVDDKRLMRERLAAAGVDDTPCLEATTAEEVTAFGERVGYPLVCKPGRGVGSQGVVRCEGPEDVAEKLRVTFAAAAGLPGSGVLVEPFHEGEEFSVECLSEDGEHIALCVTKKFLVPGRFVELGHVLPAPLPAGEEERIVAAVKAALDALGVREGATHTEVIAGEDTVRIVETHLRQGGDRIPYLLREALGADIVAALARQSIGVPSLGEVRDALEKAAGEPRSAAIWYAVPQAAGELLEVRGAEEIKSRPGVCDVVIRSAPGDRLGPVTCSADRPAHVWAVADSPEAALDTVRGAVADLRFVVGVPGSLG